MMEFIQSWWKKKIDIVWGVGPTSNNEAYTLATLQGINHVLLNHGIHKVFIIGDSSIIIQPLLIRKLLKDANINNHSEINLIG